MSAEIPSRQERISSEQVNGPRIGEAPEARESNWLPIGIAAGVLIVVVVLVLVLGGHRKRVVVALNGPPDPYAVNLPITNVVMSESGNLAGGKVTYVDGHIANRGTQTVNGIQVQVLFRSYTHEIAQNETLPLKLISMREPYIDTVPVSAAPLKPGSEQDFRLIFDKVSADWDGAYPEVRIVQVETK